MKKFMKTLAIVLVLALVAGGAIGAYFIYRHTTMYIGSDRALQIALQDSGLEPSAIRDKDIEFDSYRGSAWYDVDFETPGMEYEYSIDASTGEILYKYSEPEHL